MNNGGFHHIGLVSDHAGYELKHKIFELIKSRDSLHDYGVTSDSEPVDYPDQAKKIILGFDRGDIDGAICVCGSGLGMSMVANRSPAIRAAVVWSKESAVLSRQHNDANVLCLGGRLLDHQLALDMVLAWLSTPFLGGRHQRRVGQFNSR
ncbi:MAG: RpiB/LacA/LacB family sugar-phosphate isomerase [Proteobacteria bacterium]|nr:RpiB/LacA/LacB family sugar-phosphate isomerase [Pseudomonadota bacterium]